MAEPVGALRVELSANAAQFESDMKRARWAVGKSTTAMGKSFDSFRGHVRYTTQGLFSLQSAIAGLGVGVALKSIIQTSAEFQRLRTSLKTVTGSAEAATVAFDQIKEFAATTPFSLQEVTQGFIKLKALGLDPSAAALESYGNTASAMGKSLNDFVEAVADAITGEFERLKEFGIRSSTEGDRVKFTFQGLTTEVGKNATEIEQYLRRIGQVQFAGAMDEQAKTLGGALSNLGDSISVFSNEVGEGGLADAVEDVARRVSELTNSGHNLARQLGAGLGDAVRSVAKAMRFAGDNIRYITAGIAAFVAYRAAVVFGSVAASVAIFAVQLHTASLAMTGLTAAIRANPIGAIAAAVSAAVSALILFYDKTVQIGDVTVKVGDVVNAMWTTISETIVGLVKSTILLAHSLSSLLTLDFQGFADNWMASGRAMSNSINEIIGSWRAVGGEAEKFSVSVEKAAISTGEITKSTTTAVDKLAELRKGLEFELEQLGRTEEGQKLYNLAKKEGVEVNGQFIDEILPLIRALEQQEAAQKANKDLIQEGKDATKALRTEQEIYNDEVERYTGLLNAGVISQETFNRGVEDAAETLKDAKEKTEKVSDVARDLGMTFSSAFEDAAISGGELSDVLQGLEQDLLRLALRRFATEPIMGAFDSLLGGINPFGMTAGAGAGAAALPMTMPAPFADGGFHKGGWRIVGERGPELEYTGPSRIFSNDDTRGMLGGGGEVTVNVYAPPGSSVETRETAGPGGRTFDIILDEAVAKNIGTPGSRTGRALTARFGATPQLQGR